MDKPDRQPTLRTGHRSGSGSFSIDSLLSNTKPSTTDVAGEISQKALHYFTDLDILDRKWKENVYEPDMPEFSQKHLSLVRHIKNIDTYLPWISPNSNFFTQPYNAEHLHDDSKRPIPTTGETSEHVNFPAAYSNLHLPFLYSSWLPVATPNHVTNSPVETAEYPYSQHLARSSPRDENTDSEDSKSDVSRISDTPKDFSCTKQRRNGEYWSMIC